MSPDSEQAPSGIGAALKDARRRAGMDVKEAEERTKIRTRYLRALEAEDWEALPADAYIRGFLRVYGQELGLDGEALADEYRRRHEGTIQPAGAPVAETKLRERRRAAGSRPPSRTPLFIGIGVGIIILLVILGSIGGEEDEPSGEDDAALELRQENRKGGKAAPLEPVGATLEALGPVRVCLVGDESEALIDGQMLATGTEESFDDFKRYRLDIVDGGAVRLTSAGASKRIEEDGDASYEADGRGIREVDYAGPDCP